MNTKLSKVLSKVKTSARPSIPKRQYVYTVTDEGVFNFYPNVEAVPEGMEVYTTNVGRDVGYCAIFIQDPDNPQDYYPSDIYGLVYNFEETMLSVYTQDEVEEDTGLVELWNDIQTIKTVDTIYALHKAVKQVINDAKDFTEFGNHFGNFDGKITDLSDPIFHFLEPARNTISKSILKPHFFKSSEE